MRALIKRASLATLLLSLPALAYGCSDGDTGSSGDTTTTTTTTTTADVTVGPLGARDDLPVDEQLTLDNLSAPVDIVRDKFGRPHIYAATIADAMRAEGYIVARDRTLQLEILRRLSEGRMAEILGIADDTLVDTDITFRHIGLHRTAKKQYAALKDGDPLKANLDAFSDGVTQAYHMLQSGKLHLPNAIIGITPDFFTDWHGDDTLAIGRLQTFLLSYDGDGDVSNQEVLDSARLTFSAGAMDPLAVKRAGIERDLVQFAPATKATTTTGYPAMGVKSYQPNKGPTPQAPKKGSPSTLTKAELEKRIARAAQAHGYIAAVKRVHDLLASEGFGSNNWGVMPSKSASGHTLIASDPHLNLTAPAIFYPVSIDVKSDTETLQVGGVAFPGIPGIILGHNANVAWGATVAGYDVADAYAEELTADGKSVKFKGQDVPIEVIEEPIVIQGQKDPLVYKVMNVPHHGPILPTIGANHQILDPDPAKGAISIKWTGLEPTDEVAAVFKLLQAKNVDDAYQALQSFGVGAQNWMIGDTSGNVLWTSHALVPTRDPKAFAWDAATYTGSLPCFTLPGDGSAEWTGFLADALVPWVKNPDQGYISTANNDPIGDTLDNDPSNDKLPDGTPMYLASQFDIGFREDRIHTRLEEKATLSTDDMASIQADHQSVVGMRAVAPLVTALTHALDEKKTPGSHADLTKIVGDAAFDVTRITEARDMLDAWVKAGADAASGVDPTTNKPLDAASQESKDAQAALLFNVWFVHALRRTMGDELGAMGYSSIGREQETKGFLHLLEKAPAELATYDAATGDSAIWDDMGTADVESREERLVRAMLDTFGWVDAQGKLADLRWGNYHTIRFTALVSIYGDLSIPQASDKTFPDGFPRPGDSFGVDNSDYGFNLGAMAGLNFSYNHGPSQRFVIDLDPAGLKVYNALPGGNVWDSASPHFADEAEMWRRNQNHPVPFTVDEVVAAKESRWVLSSAAK
ncbi:MAG: penicillin acylase family protein [Polyangiaceae bacterium]